MSNVQTLGAYLQCYKNKYATYKCLESFRKFYPTGTIVLLSNNGYDYTEMAKFFNCKYIHSTENLHQVCEIEPGIDHIDRTKKLIKRVAEAFELIPEDYVIWLEDDVSINNLIRDSFKFDISGFCPNQLNYQQNTKISLNRKYPFIELRGDYRFGGQGSIYKRTTLLKSLENREVIDDILNNWQSYSFPSNICYDYLFSLLVTLNHGTVGPLKHHNDGFNDLHPELDVQHQYKFFYDKQMPKELEYLVREC